MQTLFCTREDHQRVRTRFTGALQTVCPSQVRVTGFTCGRRTTTHMFVAYFQAEQRQDRAAKLVPRDAKLVTRAILRRHPLE
eukprot:362967-Chlamydomonas_euryale.AAC.1